MIFADSKEVNLKIEYDSILKSEKVSYDDKSLNKIKLSSGWQKVLSKYEKLIDLNNIVRYYLKNSNIVTLIIPFKDPKYLSKSIAIYLLSENNFKFVLYELKSLKNNSTEFRQINLLNLKSFKLSPSKSLTTVDTLTNEEIRELVDYDLSDEDIQVLRSVLLESITANNPENVAPEPCYSLPQSQCVLCSYNNCQNSWFMFNCLSTTSYLSYINGCIMCS